MSRNIPPQIDAQLSQARGVIERHLGASLVAVHLFGSALDGGLRPLSDIDLLVTVSTPPNASVRQELMLELLSVSAPPGSDESRRALEVTVVAREAILPWRYPARRELQFGEWLRDDLVAGTFELPQVDHDLAILLTKARQHSVALVGPSAVSLFDPVPKDDLLKAFADTIAQWHQASDWEGDERTVVLALARIWYSASTGRIASKEAAADWVLLRLPAEHRAMLQDARTAYQEGRAGDRVGPVDRMAAFVHHAKSVIEELL